MAPGTGFCTSLSDWITSTFTGNYADVLVFVPTARVAARVRAQLAVDIQGVLPAILPLRGNGELADLLGIEVGAVVQPMAARLELFGFLSDVMERERDETGNPVPRGARLWGRIDGLYSLLERLALHGLTVRDLRRTVPAHLVGYWDVQAATLLAAADHMDAWLAARGEMLSGAAERDVMLKAAAIVQAEDCPWVPVVAGVLDGVPAALEIAKVAAAKGHVILPELGPVTAELAAGFAAAVGNSRNQEPRNRGTEGEPSDDGFEWVLRHQENTFVTCVAETDWDEAWMAALAVRKAVEDGHGRVAVVSPSQVLLERVSGILERWGLVVPVAGTLTLARTPAGRAALAVDRWGIAVGTPAEWLEAMRNQEPRNQGTEGEYSDDGFEEVLRALGVVADCEAWLTFEDWQAVMALVLGETLAPAGKVSDGIMLLGPLDARLLDFDVVIAAGAVEGVWPSLSSDAWLSEAHLRALGMPDAARKAMLMGTEFESVVAGGSREVIVLRARTTDGRDMVPSRFLGNQEPGIRNQERSSDLAGVLEALRRENEAEVPEQLGCFKPTGDLWPKRWSASLVETLLACPYKALGERVLRLAPLDPITPAADPRTAGLLAHRWLERAGKEIPQVTEATAAQAITRLLTLAEMEMQQETAVIRAIWRPKFAKLAPALVAQWLADGRRVDVIETRLERTVGAVTVTAKLDRVEVYEEPGTEEPRNQGAREKVIIDFKTSTPPGWASVARGERPQLALEGWLLRNQDVADLQGLEYWQLRGYGMNPLAVYRAGGKHGVEALLEPVDEGMAGLVAAYGEGADFQAVPDLAGGGLMATGHCEHCKLAGVCRRQGAAAPVSSTAINEGM